MTGDFMREERYIVFKVSDLGNSLKGDEVRRLAREYAEQRRLKGKKPLECVVVEKDWPEYEPTWRAIEARVTGVQQVPDGSAVQTAARIMNVDLIRQRDAAELMSLALQAKIEQMERQEPVMWANSSNINSSRINKERGGRGDCHTCSETQTAYHDTQLYALPGAQPAPSVPDVDALAQFIREVDGSHQLSAGVLAERIAEWLKAAPEAKP